MDIKDRGKAWNCLEIGDNLFGHRGLKSLISGARFLDWQFINSFDMVMNRPEHAAFQGFKQVYKWLLVFEKNSGSIVHVDVEYATWVICLVGKKKTFWV